MSSAFTGFVLLNEAKFDKEKFLKDLKEDWKITLDLGGEAKNKEKRYVGWKYWRYNGCCCFNASSYS